MGERQGIAQKGVCTIVRGEKPQLEIAQVPQNPAGCQRISVNTLLCATLGLAEF